MSAITAKASRKMKKYAVLTREPRCFLGSFDFSWEQRKAKELCNIGTGKSNTQDQVEDGIYPFYIRSDIPVKSNKYLYDCEAVITIGDGNIGRVFHYVNGKFDLHQRCYKMTDFQDIWGKYFYYFFSTRFYDRAMKMTAKATVDSVRLEMISEMDIWKPTAIDEQKKIAEFFANLDNLITLHQRKFEKLTNVKKSMLEKIFPQNGSSYPEIRFKGFTDPWEQRKLGELGTITTGSTPSTSIPDYYSDDGIVWVTPTDICENITFESARKLSDLGQQVGRVVPKNTILVTCIASIGKNTMLGNTGSFNQQINGLTPNEKECDPYFLLTESALWSAKMKSSAAAGTMQIVNRTEFSELKTWLPNLIEQQAISDFFRQLDNLITLHQRELEKLQNIKKSMLEKMFV